MITQAATREEIESTLVQILVEMFELEPEHVTGDARLYDDLEIDSIDAVDLVVRLKDLTGKRVEPEDFKEIRTVMDVVDTIEGLLREQA
jgi:acyl carrier protein